MTKLMIILLGTIFLTTNNYDVVHVEPVEVTKVIGTEYEQTTMFEMINGPVSLYYEPTEVIQYERIKSEGFVPISSISTDVLYIGKDKKVERINPGNYRRLIKKYFPDNIELQQRIANSNFHFKDLPHILRCYSEKM